MLYSTEACSLKPQWASAAIQTHTVNDRCPTLARPTSDSSCQDSGSVISRCYCQAVWRQMRQSGAAIGGRGRKWRPAEAPPGDHEKEILLHLAGNMSHSPPINVCQRRFCLSGPALLSMFVAAFFLFSLFPPFFFLEPRLLAGEQRRKPLHAACLMG